MDQDDDPEKRIAELERQLAEQRADGDPGANRGSQQGAYPPSPQAAFPPPPQPGFLPPPTGGSALTMGGWLTPEQVRNVAFSKRPVGERGYNEAEVDAFLDRVEEQLKSQQGAFRPSPQAAFPPPPQPGSAGLGGPHNLGDSFGMRANEESAASRQFVASSAGLALWRKFLITVSSDGLTVDRRPGDVYSFDDAQLGPSVVMGVALHLQCGRHAFWLGGRDRRVGPATRLDAPPVHSVDAWLSESDFDELLCCMGGRWSAFEARGPAPGEPTRCLLFPNPDLIHKMGPFARRKIRRLMRSLSQLQLFIDVDNDAMRVIDPNSNALNASASLSQVTATPAAYKIAPRRWWEEESGGPADLFYTPTPTMAVCLPDMQPLTIACPARFSWRGNVPVHHDPPAYTVSLADWLTLTEKCGLASI